MSTYLKEHFCDVLAEANEAKYDAAVSAEVIEISPVLRSVAHEYNHDVNYPSLCMVFKKIAQQHGSLIRSGFVVTSSASFIEYAQQCCSDYYNGERDTVYPPKKNLGHRQSIGFSQVLRIGSDTRITQPVLALNSLHLSENDGFLKSFIPELEALYRLTTHDWLHHFTMPVVGNAQISKTNKFDDLKEPLKQWNKAIESKPNDYKQNSYEAWAVVTQANLVKSDLFLEKKLQGCIERLSVLLDGRLLDITERNLTDDMDLTELLSCAKAAVGGINYIYGKNSEPYQPLISFFDSYVQNLDKEEFKTAFRTVFGDVRLDDIENGSQFTKMIIEQDSVRFLFDGTPQAERFQEKARGYTGDLLKILSAHYQI